MLLRVTVHKTCLREQIPVKEFFSPSRVSWIFNIGNDRRVALDELPLEMAHLEINSLITFPSVLDLLGTQGNTSTVYLASFHSRFSLYYA